MASRGRSCRRTIAGLDKAALVEAVVELPVDDSSVAIEGRRVRIPTWRELDAFVEDLADQGVLVVDEPVRSLLTGDESGYSKRSWQRRVRRVTGLTRSQLDRLDRAHAARELVRAGSPPAEVAASCGFADQPHLARVLRHVHDVTPGQIRGQRPAA